ncbi:unnamed protein product [Candida verbasci]|uniref:Uncharacterized protein n=1 Tax=Candida verbasci TaxID=1227364 RepID=A0A9W4XC50_9ASCO|nr:unnamed protein product [Candida verbasci]
MLKADIKIDLADQEGLIKLSNDDARKSYIMECIDLFEVQELSTRADWKQAAIDGAISTFGLGVSGANKMLGSGCTAATLGALGLAGPAAAGSVLVTCGVAFMFLAALNFASYTFQNYRQDGGWRNDADSSAAKRSIEMHMETLNNLGLGAARPLIEGLYVTEDLMGIDQLFTDKREDSSNNVLSSGAVYWFNVSEPVHVGYQLVLQHEDHNKSVFIEPDALDEAAELYKACGKSGEWCVSEHRLLNSTIAKRDSSGNWASYNDWGVNEGYLNDWLIWDEYGKAARRLAYDNSVGIVSQVQPCTNDFRCYAVSSKWCLAGGMSRQRTQDSAWVGEVYYDSYGGVDGQCYNG